jgi:hypothetical protein
MLFRPSVGKTANEINLWQNKEVDTRLTKLMGADYATMKEQWNTETPIRKHGSFFMLTGCEQHNCTENQYVIFVHDAAGKMNVLYIGKGETKEWNEYEEFVLPPPFAEELAAMKANK